MSVEDMEKNIDSISISVIKPLERDLRSCMKCKYFWGNDNRCINNKKCGSKNSTNCNAYKPKDSKCIGCPYGKDNLYCFPCMKDLLGE